MGDKCKDCNGRGRWQDRTLTYTTEADYQTGGTFEIPVTEVTWNECNTCHGLGISNYEEYQDFYIGGQEDDD